MTKTVGIGHQDFAQLVESNCFYIDKTRFIQEWWDNKDVVTLITRPRRFCKTMNKSKLEICLNGCPFGKKNGIVNCREPGR